MAKDTLKKNDLIAIVWLDAVENPSWQSAEKAGQEPLARCVSMGWFLNQDKRAIRISATIAGDGMRNVNVIPRKWVEKIVRLPSKGIKL